MTLPAEARRILARRLDPPAKYAYTVGPECANPTCKNWAEHAHHIASRSALGGEYDWIEIDGVIVGNKTGLCAECHNVVLHDRAKAVILWREGAFWWCLTSGSEVTNDREYHPVAPLSYQPPTPDTLAGRETGIPTVESEHCPACGQFKRRRRATSPPRLRRKTWIVKVPDGEVEDGADVLDTLVENLALIIPHSDAGLAGRYYVLVHSLAYSTMHSANFAQTLTGEGA